LNVNHQLTGVFAEKIEPVMANTKTGSTSFKAVTMDLHKTVQVMKELSSSNAVVGLS